ncbi:MAG: carboxypeptidase-like regulatory domain-containing protein [Candidatus Sericytochromatia bacterium]
MKKCLLILLSLIIFSCENKKINNTNIEPKKIPDVKIEIRETSSPKPTPKIIHENIKEVKLLENTYLRKNEVIKVIFDDKDINNFVLSSSDENILKVEDGNILNPINKGEIKIKVRDKNKNTTEEYNIKVLSLKDFYIYEPENKEIEYNTNLNKKDEILFTRVFSKDDKTPHFYISKNYGEFIDIKNYIMESSDNNVIEIKDNSFLPKNYGKTTIKVSDIFDKNNYFKFDLEYSENIKNSIYIKEAECYRYNYYEYNKKRMENDIFYNTDLKYAKGYVFTTAGFSVEGALVTIKSIDQAIDWGCYHTYTDKKGYYYFKNVPVGGRLEITVKKDNWTTRTRTEVLNDYNGIFEFGNGSEGTDPNNLYAIQDEPEVTEIKINGKRFIDSDTGSTLDLFPRSPETIQDVNLKGIDFKNIKIEMKFSEPVIKEDVENYFRIFTEINNEKEKGMFYINKNNYLDFLWINDKEVKININKPLFVNNSGSEKKYMIDFEKPFRDLANNKAVSKRYFRFSPSKINDFTTFSVKNDPSEEFYIKEIKAKKDLENNKNIIEIHFNNLLEYEKIKILLAQIIEPKEKLKLDNRHYSFNTNNKINNSTILGFINENGIFKTVYTISKFNKKTNLLEPLGGYFSTIAEIKDKLIRSVKIKENIVTLELDSITFDKNDTIILSTNKPIETQVKNDKNEILDLKVEMEDKYINNFVSVQDLSGKNIKNSNYDFSNKIKTSNSLKFTVVE